MRLGCITCCLLFFRLTAWGVEVTWTGAAMPLVWSDSSNWVPSQVPGASDAAVFSDQGAVALGTNQVTSIMDLGAVTTVDGLHFSTSSGLVHRVDLAGNTLKLTGDFEASINQVGESTQASIVGGNLLIGDSSSRVNNLRVGFFDASGAGEQHANIGLDVALLEAWVNNVEIGRRLVGDSVALDPVLDLSSSDVVILDAASHLYLGTINGNGASRSVAGTLQLPTNGVSTVRTPQIWLGDSPGQGNQGATSELNLGLNTTIKADEIVLGRRKSRGRMRLPTGLIGTVNIGGLNSPAANLFLGYNVANGTGTHAQGTLDVGGGILNGTFDQVRIGQHNSGNGSGRGTLIMGGGQVSANEVLLAFTDQGGASNNDSLTTGWLQMNGGRLTVTNNLVDGRGLSTLRVNAGDVAIGGNLSVDDLDVGFNQGAGTLVVNGSVRVGTGSESLELGRRSVGGSPVSSAVVDFRSSPSVDMEVENIHLGRATASGTGGFSGELQLATNGVNTITANAVRLGDSSSPGNTQVTSSLHLGAAINSLHVNWLYVGQRKSKGVMDILPGGTARMGGRTGGVMHLRVGFNNVGTATQAEGTFDMSGGHLDADFGSVVLGYHSSSSGNGRGTFVMDQGTVDADEVFLAQVGTSSNPLNTRGTLIMNGGSFQVAGDVLDKGGASRLDLNQGLFAVRGDFVVDEVTLNAPTGGTTELELNALSDDLTWKLGQYVQESNTTLRLKLAIENPVFQATNAHFEAGSLVDFAVAGTGLPNTNRAYSSVWTGGTNVWDDVASEHWSRWVPAGISLEPAGNVLIVAASNLVDNGLASTHPDWSIAVTPGPNGFITAAYTGPALPSGQIGAILDDEAASITRNGDLLLGDVLGSGAAATGVLMSGGELVVDGGVPHDGGYNYFLVDGGNVDVLNGGFDVDEFRLGYLNRSATLTVNGGAVRIGRPATPGLVDIGRREGNPSPALEHAGIGDFEDATGVRIDATELRIGSSDASNGPAFEGRLYLANSGANEIHADVVTVADSPLQGQGAETAILPPESLLNFGATTNDITTDILTVAYRKSRGRALVPHGGVVNLWGKNTGTVELRLGYNAVNTGTISTGVLDAGLGVLNGALSVLHIGRHDRGNGAGQGTLIMGGGLLTANRVDLARVSVTGTSANPENTTACLALNGGSLHVAGAIQDLGGMSTLSIDGAEVHAASVENLDNLSLLSGSLHVGVLSGSPGFLMTGGRLSADRVDFNLNLAGGTLAPGASVGRSVIQGDHLLQEARWEIELDQTTNDYVVVTGVLNLDPVDSSLDVVILNSGSNDVVIAEYGSLIGRFANENIPAGYAVDYAYQGSGRIALVPTTEFSMDGQVGFAGGMAEISWESTTGEHYSVWRTHRLQPADWIRIATGLADTAPRNTFTDPNPGGQRGYYRIERE